MGTLAVLPNALPDNDLVIRCLGGDSRAFDLLTRRYLDKVYAYLFHLSRNEAMAEDLTQDTFLKAYRALGTFDTRRHFKAWLFTIALNTYKSAMRKQQRQPMLLNDQGEDMNLLENLADPHTVPGPALSDAALGDTVKRALDSLPDSVRQAILLRHVHDLPYEDIATLMDANLNTVRTWLRRGRERLHTLLHPHIQEDWTP